MPEIRRLLQVLRKEESQLEAKLAKLRRAVAALTGPALRQGTASRPKRKAKKAAGAARAMTAAQRKAVSLRMKKYWASRKAGKKTA